MASKKQRLEDCTRTELKSLAKEYDIRCETSWKKEDYIRVLSRSRKFNLGGINEILAKLPTEGSIKEAVRSAKHDFFDETAINVFRQNDELASVLAKAITMTEIIERGYMEDIDTKSILLRNSRINRVEVPNHIKNQWSNKQWKAFGVARKTTYYVPRFLDTASRLASENPLLLRYKSINENRLPDRVDHYICQAYRSYTARCYDGCIVMLSRAIEYTLKEVLQMKGRSIPRRATLGQLIGLYKSEVGDDKIIEKILEVQNMERVICAHDVAPYEKLMQLEDADHAWTAIDIILRDLLKGHQYSARAV